MSRFQLEREISDLIRKDNNCSAHFTWKTYPEDDTDAETERRSIFLLELELVTFNPQHTNHFLLHKITRPLEDVAPGEGHYCQILRQMLDFVKNKQQDIYVYVVNWKYKAGSQKESTTSYFYGRNVEEVLEKLHYGKNPDSLIIYSITMRPES